jgi:transposase
VDVFDPGTKLRHSVYFTNGKALQIGFGTDNKYDVEILCQVKAKQRRIQSKLAKCTKAKVRRYKRKKLKKLEYQIERIMEHVDYVTIQRVLDESDVVMVPKFDGDTRKQHVFNRKVRVDASLLAHNRFVDRLKMKANLRNKVVYQVNEPSTSKTWTRCRLLKNNLGS